MKERLNLRKSRWWHTWCQEKLLSLTVLDWWPEHKTNIVCRMYTTFKSNQARWVQRNTSVLLNGSKSAATVDMADMLKRREMYTVKMIVILTFWQYWADPGQTCWNLGVVWPRALGRQSTGCSLACTWRSQTRGYAATLSLRRICHYSPLQLRHTFPPASPSHQQMQRRLQRPRSRSSSTQPTNIQSRLWTILLMQTFTVRMPLLAATSVLDYGGDARVLLNGDIFNKRHRLLQNCFHHLLMFTHTHTTVLWAFFRDHLGEPVPEENLLLDFYGAREDNRGRHIDHLAWAPLHPD